MYPFKNFKLMSATTPGATVIPRQTLIFGALCAALFISVFVKFTTLALQPPTVSQLPCVTVDQSPTSNSTITSSAINNDTSNSNNIVPTQPEDDMQALRSHFQTWINHLRATESDKRVTTERTTCREIAAKGQTCVFEGMICINASRQEGDYRPTVYFVDDRLQSSTDEHLSQFKDGDRVPSDEWCSHRHTSADPRYYSSRHWPLLTDTVVPQQSCLDAWYRTSESIFTNADLTSPKIKWVPSLAMIDLDYQENNHNTHLAMDTMWLLDAVLYQQSLDIHKRPGYRSHRKAGDEDGLLISNGTRYYMPQSREQFERQTEVDVNRLMYTLIFRKDARQLYSYLKEQKYSNYNITEPPSTPEEKRTAAPILEAFPELASGQMMFHNDIVQKKDTDLVCTSRLTAGFKTGFTADERVCREIRTRSYELFGVQRPDIVRAGQIRFAQPPKSVLIFNRHVTRKIGNGKQLADQLREKLKPLNVSVSYTTTEEMKTVEDWVRTFSSAGVIISPHGSHNMGIVWMQRHSAIIEIMPVGYTEHSFNLLSEPCKVWYHEIQSAVLKKNLEKYDNECSHRTPHMYSPCNEYKAEDVWVSISTVYPVVLTSLERLGYNTNTFLQDVHEE